jgi:hypothetical protein
MKGHAYGPEPTASSAEQCCKTRKKSFVPYPTLLQSIPVMNSLFIYRPFNIIFGSMPASS